MCASCIYKPDSPLDVKRLEAQIADRFMPGFFSGFRACHHATGRKAGGRIVCRGFWNKHRDHFTGGQLAQRLNLVQFVDVDTLKDTNGKKTKNQR
jgi:hypothetical protein